MGYFRDVNYNYENSYVRISLGSKPDDVIKHYMLSPDFDKGPYVPEISSYKDLQEYSKKSSSCIGREKPVYHLREEIPSVMSAAYDPHEGRTSDSHVYVTGYWPWPSGADAPGYYVIAHNADMISGYEDFVYYGYNDQSYISIRGEIYKMVKNGSRWAYISISIQYAVAALGLPNNYYDSGGNTNAKAYSLSSEYYGIAAGIIGSFETLQDAKAHPGWGNYISDFSPSSSRYWYSGNYINEADLFDPKQDLELVAANHLIPPGLDAKLTGEAIAQTSFNSNSIANLLDLFDLAMNIKNGDFAKILLDFRKGGKVAADAWLKYRYVYSTTKSDLEELTRYASNGVPTVCRAGESAGGGKMHVKIKLVPKTNSLGKMVDRLTSVGLAPNAYNMWDLVPFSFVVDWFVGIGDFLEGVTQYGRCAAFDIMSVTTSWTWDDYITKSKTKAKYTFYERSVSPSAPAYVPYVESRSASDETVLKRCADTVALISG